MYKKINLFELIKLIDFETLSEKYIRYILGWDNKKQYRHTEIRAIKKLLCCLDSNEKMVENFIYSYEIDHLNKEFDLIRIFENSVVNIEIKSENVSNEKIIKLLKRNKLYLSLLQKENIYQYCFIASENKLLTMDKDVLIDVKFEDLAYLLSLSKDDLITDLDDVFKIGNILVSPLNNPLDFIDGKYLLTENQENIKNEIIKNIYNGQQLFYGITGNAGTGKTLLLYDIAKTLAIDKKVLTIHSGIECDGHKIINKSIENLTVIPAAELKNQKLDNFDYFCVDEAHRLYYDDFSKIKEHLDLNKDKTCIFSFDEKQMMSKSENNRETMPKIKEKCNKEFIFELKNKIRYNKKVAVFVAALMNLNKKINGIILDNIHIIYENNKEKAVELAKKSGTFGFVYISYTPSWFYSDLDYQKTNINTHNVIGQEFDRVCMIMNDDFWYNENGKLQAMNHPNPDYIFTKLLYQGLTRAREEILLIITNENILEKVLGIFKS